MSPMQNSAELPTPLSPSLARGPISRIWGTVATVMSVLYTVIISPPAALCALVGKPAGVTHLGRFWAWLIIRTCGIRVIIEGLENVERIGPYVLASNHQSFFDIFAILAYMPGPFRFVAKKELLKIPVLGYALKNSDHIVIDRQAGGKGIRGAIEISRKGYNIAVFAEGHRHNDNHVHAFEEGAAWLALLTRLPVVPMAISGSGAFFPRKAMIVVPGGTMRMKLGAPIATAAMKSADRGALSHRLEESVRAMFSEEA